MDLVMPMNYEMIDQEEMMYLAGSVVSFGVVAVNYAAGAFLTAGSSAAWYMTTRGYFNLNRQWQWANPRSVS
ncbi:argininosuccinate lyase [Erysipelothrix urinaevulpis]|uniref:argininosuccinate lyase n=1 Tax=Erysipelothrix urinaevulpis TaxID=2683717 RepID=UPI00135B1149|nr:argininosuccinate lyase [Erysipelothrix urinaevulpis]